MHVITITGNLLAEWTFETPSVKPGKTHRAKSMTFQVGGKGINVARILHRLQAHAHAIAFADGPLGEFCRQWISGQDVSVEFFPLGNPVRPGFVIRPHGTEEFPETTFLGADMPVPVDSWTRAMSRALDLSPDWLAICGSIPGWKPNWTRPLEAAMAKNPAMALCVDTYGPPLRDLVGLPLHLVKVNRKELLGLVSDNESVDTPTLLEEAVKKFPVRNWIITNGAENIATRFAESGAIEITPAPIREASPTGSGDAFLAAFLGKWKPGEDPAEALNFATACATANAASTGIGDFSIPPPQNLYPQLRRVRD